MCSQQQPQFYPPWGSAYYPQAAEAFAAPIASPVELSRGAGGKKRQFKAPSKAKSSSKPKAASKPKSSSKSKPKKVSLKKGAEAIAFVREAMAKGLALPVILQWMLRHGYEPEFVHGLSKALQSSRSRSRSRSHSRSKSKSKSKSKSAAKPKPKAKARKRRAK